MASYPALTQTPYYPIGTQYEDESVIRSDKAAGYVHKRARFTRIRRTFSLNYEYLPALDVITLKKFYEENRAEMFFYYDFSEAYNFELIWQPNTEYEVGDIMRPSVINGHSYKCTTAGTSGSIQPALLTMEGSTITDNEVTWTENAYTVTFAAPINISYEVGLHLAKVTVVLEEM